MVNTAQLIVTLWSSYWNWCEKVVEFTLFTVEISEIKKICGTKAGALHNGDSKDSDTRKCVCLKLAKKCFQANIRH